MFACSRPGRRARLAMEPPHDLGAPREVREQHLDRDVAAQLAIARAIHRRHAALADLLAELVATERVAGARPRRRLRRARLPRRACSSRRRTSPYRRPPDRCRRAIRPAQARLATAYHARGRSCPPAFAGFIALPSRRPSSSAPPLSVRPSVFAIASTSASALGVAGQRRALWPSNADSACVDERLDVLGRRAPR